jgi:outer membrane scaffolding protein for murein synthesis (MipA/OmpV family)
VGALALGAASASAADLGSIRTMRPSPDASGTYVVTITANGQLVPRFPGSDKLTGIVYPSVNIRRIEEPARFAAPDDGFSISVLDDNPSVRFGPVVRVQPGRYLGDDRRLFGLRKLDLSIEPGVFVEYFPASFIRARLELRYSLNGVEGLVGNAGIDFIAPYDRFTFSVGPRINFADANYVRGYFGVRPGEAALNGLLPAYRPGAGIVSAGVLGAVTYRWNDTWATTGYVGYNRLVDDAARSPIPRLIGSRDQLTFGASVSYSFNLTP